MSLQHSKPALDDLRKELLAAACDARPCIFRTSCEADDTDICRCAKAADEIDRLNSKIAQVDKRINEVVLGRVMGSTSWLRDALSELRA